MLSSAPSKRPHTHTTQAPLASGPTGLGQEGDVGTEDAAACPWTLPEAWADGPLSPFGLQDPRPGPRQPDYARVRFGGLRRPWGAQPPGCRPADPALQSAGSGSPAFRPTRGRAGAQGQTLLVAHEPADEGPNKPCPETEAVDMRWF